MQNQVNQTNQENEQNKTNQKEDFISLKDFTIYLKRYNKSEKRHKN